MFLTPLKRTCLPRAQRLVVVHKTTKVGEYRTVKEFLQYSSHAYCKTGYVKGFGQRRKAEASTSKMEGCKPVLPHVWCGLTSTSCVELFAGRSSARNNFSKYLLQRKSLTGTWGSRWRQEGATTCQEDGLGQIHETNAVSRANPNETSENYFKTMAGPFTRCTTRWCTSLRHLALDVLAAFVKCHVQCLRLPDTYLKTLCVFRCLTRKRDYGIGTYFTPSPHINPVKAEVHKILRYSNASEIPRKH